MAAIQQTSISNQTTTAMAVTTLSASDTLIYKPTVPQLLVLQNTTAGSLTATIDGDGGTTVPVSGYGGNVTVSAGFQITVAAGASVAVRLSAIALFLQGNVVVTGAAGLKAIVLEG